MIIGNGMIAEAMRKIDNDFSLFFASGVSNSMETRHEEFQRETDLLLSTLKELKNKPITFYYFSTTGVENLTPLSREYFHHKKRMENIILTANHIFEKKIFRLPNVVGPSGNPQTLTNFICSCCESRNYHLLQMDARRELLDVEQLPSLVLPKQRNEIQRIDGILCKVEDIVAAFRKDLQAPDNVQALINKYYT